MMLQRICLSANVNNAGRRQPVTRRYAVPRTTLRVVAFKAKEAEQLTAEERSELSARMNAAPAKLPSLFNSVDTSAVADLLHERVGYHTSTWFNSLLENRGRHRLEGLPQYLDALQTYTSAYTDREVVQLEVLTNEPTGDVFVFTVARVKNTAPFLGTEPSQHTSHIAGMYRLSFGTGLKITDVWLYRSGTEEERKKLLKDDPSSGGLTWTGAFELAPQTWRSSPELKEAMVDNTDVLIHAVWSKGELARLYDCLDPNVQVYDAVGLKRSAPLVGVPAVYMAIEELKLQYELGPRVPLLLNELAVNKHCPMFDSCAHCGNRVAVHWTQNLRNRQTGVNSSISGITLVVFGKTGKIVQLVDFSEPLVEERELLYQERHLVQLP